MLAHCFVFVVCSIFSLTSARDYRGHILKRNGKYETIITLANAYKAPPSYADNVVANGALNQTYNATGWSVLEIKTSDKFTNLEQAYAAGILEGQLTQG